MLRVSGLSALATLAPMPSVQARRYKPASLKKGWSGGNKHMHELFKVSWFYNWQPTANTKTQAGFIPMVKGGKGVANGRIKKVGNDRKSKFLLGFNEPEREKQGNLSVEEALELWPKLEKAAKKHRLMLGSPAPSSDRKGREWLAAFMKGVKEREYRVDFIAYHWYRGYDLKDFKKYFQKVTDQYERKIWLTEFHGGFAGGDEKSHAEFLSGVLKYMEGSSVFERYAYFNSKPGTKTALLDDKGELTKLGKIYRDVGQ